MKESTARIILIFGACLCFVIGGKWIAWDIVYHVRQDPLLVFLTGLAFVPLIALAPRYKNGRVIYLFIGLAELIVIVMGNVLTLR